VCSAHLILPNLFNLIKFGKEYKSLSSSLCSFLHSCYLVPLRSKYFPQHPILRGPGSIVGIATGYRMDGPGIESQWGRDFPHLSRRARGPPSLLYNGYRVFPGSKERPGCDADPTPPSRVVVKKR
jgi:hypothetical protein